MTQGTTSMISEITSNEQPKKIEIPAVETRPEHLPLVTPIFEPIETKFSIDTPLDSMIDSYNLKPTADPEILYSGDIDGYGPFDLL